MKMLRVYPASKLRHADKFRNLNQEQNRVYFSARWLQQTLHKTPDEEENAKNFWQQNVYDVKTADAVLVYAESEDKLHGALVEAGAAIAFGVPVIVVGEHPDYSTWRHHPEVIRLSYSHAG